MKTIKEIVYFKELNLKKDKGNQKVDNSFKTDTVFLFSKQDNENILTVLMLSVMDPFRYGQCNRMRTQI